MVSMTVTVAMAVDPCDAVDALFTQVASQLSDGRRDAVAECIGDGDYAMAALVLVKAVDALGIAVDQALFAVVRAVASTLDPPAA